MPEAAPVAPIANTPVAPQPGAAPAVQAKQPVTSRASAEPPKGGPPVDDEIEIEGERYPKSKLKALLSRGKEAQGLMSAANKRMQEAEAKAAEAEKREAVWKSGDPAKVRAELRKLGYDTRAMSEAEVNEAIKDEMLTPEQKKIREYEQKLKEKEDAEAEQKRKQEEEAQAAEVEATTHSLAQTFVNALASKGIPTSHARALLPHYAQIVRSYNAAGMEAPLDVVADHLATQDSELFNRHLGSLEPEAILQKLGPDKAKALQKYWLQQYQEGRQQKAGGTIPGTPAPKPVAARGVPQWMSKAPADVRRAYFNDGGEKSITVVKWLATQQVR